MTELMTPMTVHTEIVGEGENENVLLEKRILFVCTGNTCRSPMAEAYMKSKGYKNVSSRGIGCRDGERITYNAVYALKSLGIMPTDDNDFENHTSKKITDEDMRLADEVYGMTPSHTSALIFAFPQYASKIHTMPRCVSDPYGGGLEIYVSVLKTIAECIDNLFFL